MTRFWIIACVLLLLILSGCAASRGHLTCDLADSGATSQYTDATEMARYSLRCSAAGSQYGETTAAD